MDDPSFLLEAIPRHIQDDDKLGEGNISFRKRIHKLMAGDPGMYRTYLELCAIKPQILFNSAFWVYEARADMGKQNIPFILRPMQDFAVDRLKYAIDHATRINPHNILIDKSREEGATEIICKLFAAYFLLFEDTHFLVGSRVEDFVDKATNIKRDKQGLMRVHGNHKCLFHKIMYALTTIPPYMQPMIQKSHLLLESEDNGSSIGGEATTNNFGAGDRAKAVLIDECARIEPDIAQHIIGNIQDVTYCGIFNSTHFKWGSGHPYAHLINSNKIEVLTLAWEDNPEKNPGLYHSDDVDHISIKDIDYYRAKCPTIFEDIELGKPFVYSDLQLQVAKSSKDVQEEMAEINFIADGGEGNFGCDRSPWYDSEESRPGRTRQGMAMNVLRIPQGSADQFFDEIILKRIEKKYVKDPSYTGTVKYEIHKMKPVDIEFQRGGPKLLKWWGPMPKGRPRQDHNYIVSCDISRGTGSSNSVATITDVNTSEVVGVYVNPFIDVVDFAELSVALCLWAGGATRTAYLIWDGIGPGETFTARIRKIGYTFVYYKVDEKKKTRKRPSNKTYGFHATAGINGTKLGVFGSLDAALNESLQKNKRFPYLILHDIEIVRELREYIFLGDRIDIGSASAALDSSGARYAHGDRATAAAMTMLAMKEQPKASIKKAQKVKRSSMLGRMQERDYQRKKSKQEALFDKW